MDLIQTFFWDLIDIINEMSPYLIIGFLLAGILKVFLAKNFIMRYLSNVSTQSVVNASLLGIPLPLCSCGVIPTGISLYKNGASKGASVSFLTSTPQTGVDSILVTYSLLGLPFAIIRVIVALITGVFSGTLTDIINKPIRTKENTIAEKDIQKSSFANKIAEVFRYAFVEFLADIAKWIIIGLIIAALISAFLPDNFFTLYIRNDFLGMLTILTASIPLYVCATASVPIAAVLMIKGLSPGAALVFLMAGPATNAATITVTGKVLGKKTLFAYLLSIIGSALIFGWIINNRLPSEWFSLSTLTHVQEHGLLPLWLKYTSSIILILLIINTFVIRLKSKIVNTDMENMVIKVEGMTCNHCKENIEKAVQKLTNVKNAIVNLKNKQVYINGKSVDIKEVKNKIKNMGYQFIEKVD